MIDSMLTTIKWNKLFNWRCASIAQTDLLNHVSKPATFILSARAFGMKGWIPGSRHSWVATFNGVTWKVYEISDLETLKVQDANVLHAEYSDLSKLQLVVSDRQPSTKWFGNTPSIDYEGPYIDICVMDYPMNTDVNLYFNNCNTFISYLVDKYNLDYNCRYIGYKPKSFWQPLIVDNTGPVYFLGKKEVAGLNTAISLKQLDK